MEDYKKIAIAVLTTFVLIIIAFVVFDSRINEYEDFMYGLWVADEDFCRESGVDSILLFIGPEDTGFLNTVRKGHIIINNDYSNQGFTIKYRKGSIIGIPTSHHDYSINAEIEFEEDDIMSNDIQIELSMKNNKMRIRDDEQLFGIFYKDHETTEICDSITE